MYHGTVKNGVIVVEGRIELEKGARVRVEPVTAEQSVPPVGSPEAVLSADLKWVGDPTEIDELLAQVQRMRDEDLELQSKRDK